MSKESWSERCRNQRPGAAGPMNDGPRQHSRPGRVAKSKPLLVETVRTFAPSKLNEYGIKGSFWMTIYTAFDYFEPAARGLQCPGEVSNNSTKFNRYEFEARGW